MSTKKMTMTPEWEADAILATAGKLSPTERDAMVDRLARAIRAEAALPDLLAALRDATATLDPAMHPNDIRALRTRLIAAIAITDPIA